MAVITNIYLLGTRLKKYIVLFFSNIIGKGRERKMGLLPDP